MRYASRIGQAIWKRSGHGSLATATAAVVAGGCVFATTPASAAAAPPMPVAVQHQNAPLNGSYLDLGPAVLSADGRVAFTSDVLGGATRRVLVSTATPTTAGTASNVAVSNAPAGGGGTFANFYSLTQSSTGRLGFGATHNGGTSFFGVYEGNVGAINTVALSNTAAPSGDTFGNTLSLAAINDAGRVVFVAPTRNATNGTTADGIFTGTAGALETLVLQGGATPADPSYGTYSSFSMPRMNGSGVTVFQARVGGYTGIFAGTPGAVQVVAFENQTTPDGGTFGSLGSTPRINDAGQIAFSSQLYNGPTSGIFLGPVGAVQSVALRGAATPAGGTFGLLETNVVLNGAGKVAFEADVLGGPTAQGIFLGDASSLTAVATRGAAAPEGGTFNTLGDPALNGAGQVAFTSTLSGLTTANDVALFGGSPGNLIRIVGEGDLVDVVAGPGVDLRTVQSISFFPGSGGQDGTGVHLADNGTVVYELNFTNGTHGIFVSAVPEPGIGMLALGAVAAACLSRPRRRA